MNSNITIIHVCIFSFCFQSIFQIELTQGVYILSFPEHVIMHFLSPLRLCLKKIAKVSIQILFLLI